MRALVVEDDDNTRAAIETILRSETHFVDSTGSGEDAVEMARDGHYDVVLLDLGLPDISGFDVMKGFWAHRIVTPVIVVSGVGAIEIKVKALRTGAADFMVKPFHRSELVARINAVTRRVQSRTVDYVDVGLLRVDFYRHEASYGGAQLNLTRTQFNFLEILALSVGKQLPKEIILARLYGYLEPRQFQTLSVHLCHIRKRLDEVSGGMQFIVSRHGAGLTLLKEPLPPMQQAAE